MKICIVGVGYVGLVTGAGFAETGNDVVCADIDATKIEALKAGKIPIFEPGLGELVASNVADGRLSFTTDLGASIAGAQVVVIGVGTPPLPDGRADLSAVEAVAKAVTQHAAREMVLVMKSTVPVQTNVWLRELVKDAKFPIHVVSNPEFLKEGDAVNDFLRPERVIVGCDQDDTFARDLMARLYHPLCLKQDHLLWMDPASAELSKYVANTMLAMRISFMNEVAALCEKVGADIHRVRAGVGSDSRIGNKFLYAGPGYGGSCFPKDVTALYQTARQHGVELSLAEATDRTNRRQKQRLFEKLLAKLGNLKGERIAVWGIAFKPRTDDIREAPALTLIDALLEAGASVVAHDPESVEQAKLRYGERVEFVSDPYQTASGASALVLVTEWRQYQNPDFERIKGLMKRPVVIDGRNIWSGYGLRKMGFEYEGIGVLGS